MAVFLSTYVNKVDKKGRVSVPADFRKVLSGQSYQGVVVFKSLQYPALEACSADHMEQLSDSLEALDLSNEDYELYETTIFGGSVQVPFDGEGRIVLPEHLARFANISEEAAFVGRRKTFQIWEPRALSVHEDVMRDKARSRDVSLSKIIAKASQLRGGLS
ncbi:MAG: division/cell wall cluster transcriptional repressor MraZ [Rhodospirillaceae bacterium]